MRPARPGVPQAAWPRAPPAGHRRSVCSWTAELRVRWQVASSASPTPAVLCNSPAGGRARAAAAAGRALSVAVSECRLHRRCGAAGCLRAAGPAAGVLLGRSAGSSGRLERPGGRCVVRQLAGCRRGWPLRLGSSCRSCKCVDEPAQRWEVAALETKSSCTACAAAAAAVWAFQRACSVCLHCS